MPDFSQNGPITTIHDLGTIQPGDLEERLNQAAASYPIGLVLPITASDMRAAPFQQIVHELSKSSFLDTIVVVPPNQPNGDRHSWLLSSGIPNCVVGDALAPRTAEEAVYEGLTMTLELLSRLEPV